MKITARVALTGLLLSFLTTFGIVSITSPADATCSARQCSQVKNADNSTKNLTVYCQNAGYTSVGTLGPGAQSGCGRYVYAMEIYFGSSLYCKPMGSSQPFVYYGGQGYYPFISDTRLTCLVV